MYTAILAQGSKFTTSLLHSVGYSCPAWATKDHLTKGAKNGGRGWEDGSVVRALTVLAEDMGWMPGTCMVAHNCQIVYGI